jgi:hypothetical protein
MNSVVSLETAQALKAAGFPQPDPALGQFWYEGKELCVIVVDDYYAGLYSYAINDGSKNEFTSGIFAPTATDVIAAMLIPEVVVLRKGNLHHWGGSKCKMPTGIRHLSTLTRQRQRQRLI